MLRLFKGLLGSWAGLTIATFIISAVNGSIADATTTSLSSLAIVNLIFAGVAAIIIAFIEKPHWTWKTYAVAGAFTTGLVLFMGFCVIAGALVSAGTSVGALAYVITAVTSAASGILTGLGYRSANTALTA